MKLKIIIEESISSVAIEGINEVEILIKAKISPKEYELIYGLVEGFDNKLSKINT